MENLRKITLALRNWVELYIPITSFVVMFLAFIWQIFSRYILNQPQPWAYEVTVTCYLWMVVLGACYAQRTNSHVVFTLIYDKLPLKWKALTAFLGNALIFFAFVWSFVPSIRFIEFMRRQETSVFKVGLNIVYAPYIPFLFIMILYAGIEMVKQARVFAGIASEAEIQSFLDSNKSEVEEAIEEAHKMEEPVIVAPEAKEETR